VEGRALIFFGIFGDAASPPGLVRLDPVDLLLGDPVRIVDEASLSDSVSTLPPSWTIFSAAWVATLPEPEMSARLPARSCPRVFSIFSRK